MSSRLDLHTKLCEILGTKNVYFQPPESIKLVYPCFIYNINNFNSINADNLKYFLKRQYQLTYITKNPDDPLIDSLNNEFDYIRFDRFFTSDNLNHYVYTIYF